MGVSGSGKSTIAAGIARLLSLPFIDGDELHSPLSVAKMKAGIALEDEDRWPWLDRIAARLADRERMPAGLVITCSALKRRYRDRIRRARPRRPFRLPRRAPRTPRVAPRGQDRPLHAEHLARKPTADARAARA